MTPFDDDKVEDKGEEGGRGGRGKPGKDGNRRISGNCAKHQRKISTAVKQARMIALLPFTVTGK
jgi:hypothetical protein